MKTDMSLAARSRGFDSRSIFEGALVEKKRPSNIPLRRTGFIQLDTGQLFPIFLAAMRSAGFHQNA
jgi:hypothetical protein